MLGQKGYRSQWALQKVGGVARQSPVGAVYDRPGRSQSAPTVEGTNILDESALRRTARNLVPHVLPTPRIMKKEAGDGRTV